MPRIIFRCPYIKGGTAKAAAHLENLVGYIATRQGVERVDPGRANWHATKNQRAMIEKLLREFPLSRGLFEYEDYLAAPTRANASDFITRAIEDNLATGALAQAQRSGLRGERRSSGMDELSASAGSEGYGACDNAAKRENYLEYIAKRPRAQQMGPHGLFTGTEESLVLSQVADAVAHHPGNVWLPIISLRREDAARLGYDNAENWRALLSSYALEMAEAMKIPWEQFRWYAAFHDEGHHPHVHMVCYSADPAKGFLSRAGIAKIKSDLAKRIFRQELTELYARQTQRRDTLTRETGAVMERLIRQMQTGALENARIEQLMAHLSHRLQFLSGKKQYGYLKAPLKSVVDEIVDELAKDPRVAEAYRLWYELREDVLHTYKEDMPARLPLSQQKEFKQIKNLVIREAARLGEHAEVFDEAAEQEPPDINDALTPDAERDGGDAPLPDAEPPIEDDPAPEEAPPEEETDPKADWSDRYKQARSFLFGSEDTPRDFEKAFSLLLKEARSGNALAMHDLGRMFADGLGRDIDPEQAQCWYAKALSTFLTVEEEKAGRYVEYRIGKMYAAGLGTAQDYSEAAGWFKGAAERGHKYAQYSLAGLYCRGQGVEQNHTEALHLYTRSAEQGFPYAAFELGKMYRDGVGCEKDEASAADYFAQAFAGFCNLEQQSHDDKLQYRIGWMLLHGVGADRDEAAAREWFEKAAQLGNPHAQYQLAKIILADPASGPEQTARALEWLTRAAEAGQDCAQYALGKLYRDGGKAIQQDTAKAVKLFTKAAEQDNSFAAFALARLLLDGADALPKDVPTALVWLRRSAEQVNQYAQYRLGKILLQGEPIPKDTLGAIRWLTKSAEQGNQFAQYALGKIYLLGRDAPRDKEAAARWFTLAAAQGNEFAQYFLDHMDDPPGSSLLQTATRLLHHLGNIFREQTPPPSSGGMRAAVDRKFLRKIREKKIAQGHKQDDHEPTMTL